MSTPEGEAQRRPCVLLADADSVTAEVIQHRLERSGFDVAHYGTGHEAVSALCDVEPDLCIIELKLPDMEGFELIEQIRRNLKGREVPVLVLTSVVSEKMIARAFSLGADDYILKPFSLTELTARVRRRLSVAATTSSGV